MSENETNDADQLEQTLPADSNIPTLQPGVITTEPPPPPVFTLGRVDYTLTSADAAAINAHLPSDYVKEGLVINASVAADGKLFVTINEATVLLGAES